MTNRARTQVDQHCAEKCGVSSAVLQDQQRGVRGDRTLDLKLTKHVSFFYCGGKLVLLRLLGRYIGCYLIGCYVGCFLNCFSKCYL